MCKTFSAILTKSEELIFHPEFTDSHEDLLRTLNMFDNGESFVRLEFCPTGNDYADLKSYKLKVDQRVRPGWFDEHVEKRVFEKLYSRVKRMIVIKDRNILLGGCWILVGKICVDQLQNCRIINAGSSTIEYVESSTIINAESSTIKYAELSTIINAESSTIEYAGSSIIMNAGSSTIKNAESSTVVNKY